MLEKLDCFERVPSFYNRDKIEVATLKMNPENSIENYTCFSYFLRNFKDELLSLSFEENYLNENNYVPPADRKNGTSVIDMVKK